MVGLDEHVAECRGVGFTATAAAVLVVGRGVVPCDRVQEKPSPGSVVFQGEFDGWLGYPVMPDELPLAFVVGEHNGALTGSK